MSGDVLSQPKATVLVVDDEAAVRRVLVMRLQLAGYRVVCAEDGELALSLFHSESPDLVVLDVCLLYTSPSPRDRQKSRMPSSA